MGGVRAVDGAERALCGDRSVLSLCHCVFIVVVVTQIYTGANWHQAPHILYNVSFHFRYWSIIMKVVVMVDHRWRVHVTSLYYFCKFLWIYNYFRTLKFKVKTLLSLQQEFSQDDRQDLAADLRPATQLLWDQSAQLPTEHVEKKWWLVEHGAQAAVCSTVVQ